MTAGTNNHTSTQPAPDWSMDADMAAGIERWAYRSGWWWGFASGLICGGCSVALLGGLLYVASQALACPTC